MGIGRVKGKQKYVVYFSVSILHIRKWRSKMKGLPWRTQVSHYRTHKLGERIRERADAKYVFFSNSFIPLVYFLAHIPSIYSCRSLQQVPEGITRSMNMLNLGLFFNEVHLTCNFYIALLRCENIFWQETRKTCNSVTFLVIQSILQIHKQLHTTYISKADTYAWEAHFLTKKESNHMKHCGIIAYSN